MLGEGMIMNDKKDDAVVTEDDVEYGEQIDDGEQVEGGSA